MGDAEVLRFGVQTTSTCLPTQRQRILLFQSWPRAAGAWLADRIWAKPQAIDPQHVGRPTQLKYSMPLIWWFCAAVPSWEHRRKLPQHRCPQPSKYDADLQGKINTYLLPQLPAFPKLRAEGDSVRLLTTAKSELDFFLNIFEIFADILN